MTATALAEVAWNEIHEQSLERVGDTCNPTDGLFPRAGPDGFENSQNPEMEIPYRLSETCCLLGDGCIKLSETYQCPDSQRAPQMRGLR